jgi:hypothetical protein
VGGGGGTFRRVCIRNAIRTHFVSRTTCMSWYYTRVQLQHVCACRVRRHMVTQIGQSLKRREQLGWGGKCSCSYWYPRALLTCSQTPITASVLNYVNLHAFHYNIHFNIIPVPNMPNSFRGFSSEWHISHLAFRNTCTYRAHPIFTDMITLTRGLFVEDTNYDVPSYRFFPPFHHNISLCPNIILSNIVIP